MQNHPEELFRSLKQGCFPTAMGEEERKLRIAFFYGLDAMRQMIVQAVSDLSNKEMATFSTNLREQITAELTRLGQPPAKIKLLLKPNSIITGTSINGESI
jgi:hypothetical protein